MPLSWSIPPEPGILTGTVDMALVAMLILAHRRRLGRIWFAQGLDPWCGQNRILGR